jgi:cell division GTPase FtsZ
LENKGDDVENIENADEMLDMGDMLDISDIPMPDVQEAATVEDEIQGKTAFKFCFIGAGQGGGRIAHQFWKYGYRRVCAINTASADLEPLGAVPKGAKYPEFPASNKLKIGSQEGAGGNPAVGRAAAKESREDIFNLMRNSFGDNFDYIFITATAGGGTGSGSIVELVSIARELIEKQELQNSKGKARVGVILALPKESDGRDVQPVAAKILEELSDMTPQVISPLILIDNQRIQKLYPKVPVGQISAQANHSACSIFHFVNLVSARVSPYTSFDSADFESILESGILAYGAMAAPKWENRDDISTVIRSNLTKNVLVDGVDISTGGIAGCVIVGDKQLLDNELPQEYLDDSFSMLSRMVKQGSPIRRGVYAGSNKGIVVYTLIGGLDKPAKKLQELKKLGGGIDFDGA